MTIHYKNLHSNILFIVKLLLISISSIFTLESIAQDNNSIIHYVNNKDWISAEKAAKASNDVALLNLVLSQKFLDTNYPNSFTQVIKFIESNHNWPQIEKIQKAAESYIDCNTDKKYIIHWFNNNQPKTGKGYKFYALAASSVLKDDQRLKQILKDGWVYGEFTKPEEQKYLHKFSKYLTQEDHVKRIDECLWKHDIAGANNLMHIVDAGHKKAFITTIAAIQNKSSTDQLLKEVGVEYYTNSLLFHYLKYKKYSKALPDNDILSILKHVKKNDEHSCECCNIQIYWAREFLYAGDYEGAYKVISNHFALEKDDLRESEWLAGWIALRFLHKPKLAKVHFKKFIKIVKTPMSLARGNYWLGRTYAASENSEKAKKYYKIASDYSYTFYGQLSSIELNENKIILPNLHPHHKSVPKNSVTKAIKYLIDANNLELARAYTKCALEQLHKDELLYLVNEVHKKGNVHYSTEFAKLASQNHLFIRDYVFPTPYKQLLSQSAPETPDVYSLMRQETVFNQFAVSNKDAMGLMQLIEDTACTTAKSLNMKCSVSKLTKDPGYNIKLGTKYFKDLLKERNGSYILALASYNTAGRNVDKWVTKFGDPRQAKDLKQVIDWLELIPFHETRNFVQRVLENIQVYKSILNKNNTLHLKNYLLVA